MSFVGIPAACTLRDPHSGEIIGEHLERSQTLELSFQSNASELLMFFFSLSPSEIPRMSPKTAFYGLTALAMLTASGVASAQTPMKTENMAKSDSKAMSKSDMKMMKSCQAMDHDRMMADSKCKAMMDAHPDAMKDGMMKSDGVTKK
jgi:hypothetical protein